VSWVGGFPALRGRLRRRRLPRRQSIRLERGATGCGHLVEGRSIEGEPNDFGRFEKLADRGLAVRTVRVSAAFLVFEVSIALGVAVTYAIGSGGCAPPSVFCVRGDVLCATVCTNAWAQLPELILVGAAGGLLPAALAAWAAGRWAENSRWIVPPRAVMVLPVLSVMGLSVLLNPIPGIVLTLITYPLTVGLLGLFHLPFRWRGRPVTM